MARRSHEFGRGALELDHLHTQTRAPRSRVRSLTALAAVCVAVMLGGGAMFTAAGSSPAPRDPAANSVHAVAGAPTIGPATGMNLNEDLVDIAATPSGRGYWTVASDGGVFGFGDAAFHGSSGSIPLEAPITSIAATPSGNGYWLVAADGGVFGYGDAAFHGSMGGTHPVAPIVGIASTRSGKGYWLTGADGGVFGFGDARFFGSAAGFKHNGPILGIAATRSGRGYYLISSDGGVFGYGDARFAGAAVDNTHISTGIAVPRNGRGYMISRTDGSVAGFGGAPSVPAPVDARSSQHPVVGIAPHRGGGAWLALGYNPPPPPRPATPDLSQDPFLKCTRAHESDSAGGYHARSADGLYYGAYQFLKSTWNNVARAAGRPDLVGVDPSMASPHDQDFLAYWLFTHGGPGPWGGRCAGLS